MTSKELLAEALQLSDEERAALAGELIQSLDPAIDLDAEAAWAEEIRRRVHLIDSGPAETVSWPEARPRLHAVVGRGPGA